MLAVARINIHCCRRQAKAQQFARNILAHLCPRFFKVGNTHNQRRFINQRTELAGIQSQIGNGVRCIGAQRLPFEKRTWSPLASFIKP